MVRITNWSQAIQKACEWRILAFGIDLLIAFWFTGELKSATGIASLSAFIKFTTNLVWIKRRFS